MYRFLDRAPHQLDSASRFLVGNMRKWVVAAASGQCVCSALRDRFHAAALDNALPDFAMMMALLNRYGLRQMQFAACVHAPVTEAEASMLALIGTAITGKSDQLKEMAALHVRAPLVPDMTVALERLGMALCNADFAGSGDAGATF